MKNLIIEKAFAVWSFLLISMFVVAFGIAIFNLVTGNFHSTASFEF